MFGVRERVRDRPSFGVETEVEEVSVHVGFESVGSDEMGEVKAEGGEGEKKKKRKIKISPRWKKDDEEGRRTHLSSSCRSTNL